VRQNGKSAHPATYLEKLSFEVRGAYNMFFNKTPCDQIFKNLYISKLPTKESKVLGTSDQHVAIKTHITNRNNPPHTWFHYLIFTKRMIPISRNASIYLIILLMK